MMPRVIATRILPAGVKHIGPAVDGVMRLVTSCVALSDRQDGVELALREAVSNAVIHGSKADPSKTVSIHVAFDGAHRLVFVVRDRGTGFDPCAVPSPLGRERLLAPSGRGIHLIRTLMDEVSFRDGGREIWMAILARGDGRREGISNGAPSHPVMR